MSTWTKQKPSQPGWYWMLNPREGPGLPTIVQILRDWQTGRWLALIPASPYHETSGMVLELQLVDVMWAGPLQIPSVVSSANQEESTATSDTQGEDKNLAAR